MRYTFFKNIYKDYVILLSRRKSYVTYERDTFRVADREFIRKLRDNKVNFLITDGLEIVLKSE